ncbi:phospholipase D1 [Cordyceps fumosorosea ARSEF 2679]|uniref:Phospholipase D1 n=1 Tax=Cordyceps fumosorosea (strain ARSEF 2679) TaxID=1081104 RepID=A0A167QJI8_CORFA|nr:phospholipase D1 [Cordyceps fumosorosea ARSEF 2679]OAA57699.1 phospholipase D1 [Cordyceps fumosorosea ARSEF 2679]
MARDDSVSPFSRSPQKSPTNDEPYVPPVVGGSLAASAPEPGLDRAAVDKINLGENEAASSDPTTLSASLPPQNVAESNSIKSFGHPAGQASPSTPGTPSARVQFARFDPPAVQPSHSRHNSAENPEAAKSRSASIMSKLKSLTPTSLQSTHPPPSLDLDNSQSAAASPTASRFASRVSDTLHEEDEGTDADMDGEADADVEEEADETQTARPLRKKKRRMRRFVKGDGSAPASPFRFPSDGDALSYRFLRRRASMPDTSVYDHALSEGETTRRRRRRPFVRRGHSLVNTGIAQHETDIEALESSAVVGRRHGHHRRITVFGGGGVSDGDAIMHRRPFFHSERASNFGAQKWKQVKSTLKLLRQRKDDRIDYYKSTELMAELRAGAPAVLMFASMIQRDENGNKRIPVLLEQLKLTVTDSRPGPGDEKEYHHAFTLQLEYGSGPSRMVWTVVRSMKDIYNLHFRYKIALNNDMYLPGQIHRPKQPNFPYYVFPYLRNLVKGGKLIDEEIAAASAGEQIAEEGGQDLHGDDAEASGSDGGGNTHPRRKRSIVNLFARRRSTGLADNGEGPSDDGPEAARQRYMEKQRRALEQYFSQLIRWLMFRADSNRLCRFLELSALGIRLAAERSYHGKECYLHIQSAKGPDFRRVLTPAKVIARHSRKWFLVRQSYIVCVEAAENMNIYDVYLVDSKFSIASKRHGVKRITSKKDEFDLTMETPSSKSHTLTLRNGERKLRLFARHHSAMRQFQESINEMLKQTVWSHPKRFGSYAPVRQGVFAQWLVDGRDYMWNVSRAINMAKDVIYIHDWWLSPELYLRRPAAISQKWRLDRLLQKKASEGVKVFVIIYRNVEAAIPIDSEYTKFSLLNLHPNIFVQRSPNQFKKNQFFFAHHEKICIVDHDVAFTGGVDLCFGRWDCPQHPIVDDKPTGFEMDDAPRDVEHCQLFPGKDYSNPRVQDFFRLGEPYEEMYDRSRVPRMPWHDIGMQVVGQPARDLTRHFVQRWNYLRRGRKSTRPLPFLLPPPEANFTELESLGLTGTCEVQMLRSASNWSLGLEETEHSIQTAYVKMIEDSEHLVYIENQFFISSTEAYNTRIVNRIGDAIVHRIVRAHENGESWRCIILIPLMPGFQNTVDEQEGTSVRLIIMCQLRSICRGENSIFGRLRAAGIDPEDYIDFFSLRQWGIMSTNAVVTEQLYIHAKCMIVDDRVAIIGSANINERSMVGHRDSEVAAIVRDTDMIWSTMGGKPYQVGRFAHTLRMRLMREHLGLDTDAIQEEERGSDDNDETFEEHMDNIYSNRAGSASGFDKDEASLPARPRMQHIRSFNSDLDIGMAKAVDPDAWSSDDDGKQENKGKTIDGETASQAERRLNDVSGFGADHWKDAEQSGHGQGRDSVIVNGHEFLVRSIDSMGKGTLADPEHKDPQDRESHLSELVKDKQLPPLPPFDERAADVDDVRPAQLTMLPESSEVDAKEDALGAFRYMTAEIKMATITKDCMVDPIASEFIDDIWNRVARNNTKLYRKVFRCMPDSEVKTWSDYRDFVAYNKKFQETMEVRTASEEPEAMSEARGSIKRTASSGAIGISVPDLEALASITGEDTEKLAANLDEQHNNPDAIGETSDEAVTGEKSEEAVDEKAAVATADQEREVGVEVEKQSTNPETLERKTTTFANLEKAPTRDTAAAAAHAQFGSVKRRRRATTKGSRRWSNNIEDMPSRTEAEGLLRMVQGNLVEFPYDWLVTEEHNGNWGYQVDGVAPLAI